MIYRSKAPLRIGLAGGGTDVSPYCDIYGGSILNATISLFAHSSIEVIDNEQIVLFAPDRSELAIYDLNVDLPIDGKLDLLKGVYNRIRKDYYFEFNRAVGNKGLKITTYVDAPAGSGLGTSSTLIVAILGAFVEMLQLPMGEYDIAKYAYEIERIDLQLAGGKQDQYAATFGGVNFMEFHSNNNVIVNPLRIKSEYLSELENNLVLFFTATSRSSAKIIKEQQKNVNEKKQSSIEAMHHLKDQSRQMKEALLKGDLINIGLVLDYGFKQKRLIAANISNPMIDSIYESAIKAGALGGKISGAGGGGFMIFYCPGNSRYSVIEALSGFEGKIQPYQFVSEGLKTWAVGSKVSL
ncbi:MAG: dehydrogenase [Bacteroidota bacterium]|nr:dehydrogenase [Bacteroidota bacterium]